MQEHHREIGVVEAVRLILVFSVASIIIPSIIMIAGFLVRVSVGILKGVWRSLTFWRRNATVA